MKSATETYLILLQRRLALLLSLSSAEDQGRDACIARDLEALHACTAHQKELCRQLHALDQHLAPVQKSAQVECPDSALCTSIREVLLHLAQAQQELQRRNRVQQSLLRRARRNLQALAHLFQGYAPSYAVPTAPRSGSLCEERV